MLVVDDILTAPLKGLLLVFREIQEAVEAELEADSEDIVQQLQELYMLLETERITQEEFDRREAELLDLLDALEGEE